MKIVNCRLHIVNCNKCLVMYSIIMNIDMILIKCIKSLLVDYLLENILSGFGDYVLIHNVVKSID